MLSIPQREIAADNRASFLNFLRNFEETNNNSETCTISALDCSKWLSRDHIRTRHVASSTVSLEQISWARVPVVGGSHRCGDSNSIEDDFKV